MSDKPTFSRKKFLRWGLAGLGAVGGDPDVISLQFNI